MTGQAERILRSAGGAGARGYQRIILPDGSVIPGWDRRPVADVVFPSRLDDRSVLDVGCDYGFFLHEAAARGASRALGIEAEATTHAVAAEIAALGDGRVEIRRGRFEDLAFDERFDLVLCLNVLHHAADPWAFLRKVSSLCRGTVAVEFPLPSGFQFRAHALGRPESALAGGPRPVRGLRRLRHALWSAAFRRLARGLPLIGVGSAASSRTFFFDEAAFRNAFGVHEPIFRRIEFHDSPSGARERRIALCQVAAEPSARSS